MITGTKKIIGKRVTAYIPWGHELQKRKGYIQGVITTSSTPMYMVKYDGFDVPHAAQPSWLVFETNE